jgi:hypothetical protein
MINRRTLAAGFLADAGWSALPVAGLSAPPPDARAIAMEAYLYAFAILENYQTWYKQAVDTNARRNMSADLVSSATTLSPSPRLIMTSSRRTTTRRIPGHGSTCAPNPGCLACLLCRRIVTMSSSG